MKDRSMFPALSVTRLIGTAVIALACLASAAQAATMPHGARKVSLTAREQPINAFLQNLFASVDVPANISPELNATINGRFSGRASRILRDISRIYNLVGYYDGAIMHVVPTSALVRRSYAATPKLADRMQRLVGELNMTDARNTLRRSSDGSMQAIGARRFIEQLDDLFRANQTAPAKSAVADFRVFYLRYAWAQDVTMTLGGRQVVVPGVASILRSVVGANTSRPLGRETVLPPKQPGLRGQGLAAQGRVTPVTNGAQTGQRNNNGQPSGQNPALDNLVSALSRTAQPRPVPEAIEPQTQVHIEADPRLNAVIVRDRADRLARYEQLIKALDIEPLSVEIEATIIDVNTDRMRELGVDWRINRGNKSLSFSGGVPTDGIGGAASMIIGSATQFFTRIRALQTEGAARIVSSPQVVTLSNVEAVFDNSSTFFVRVAGREQVDLFNVKAGTSLRVTPNVFRDREQTRIKLLVHVEDGNLTGRQVDQIPVVERSSINTQALIHEGESLLIGGMTRDTATSRVDKVPGLGDVPVLGNLFRTKGKTNTRVERMFLITPRIAVSRRAKNPAAAPTGLQAGVQRPGAPVAGHTSGQASRVAVAPGQAAKRIALPRRRSSLVLDLNAPLPVAAKQPARRAQPAQRTRPVRGNLLQPKPRISVQQLANDMVTGG